jgi:MtrB/PioB family decaheme-associated outer membrane protein
MTRTISLIVALGLSAPVLAQDPAADKDKITRSAEQAVVDAKAPEAQVTPAASVEPSPSSWLDIRRVDVGVRGRDLDTNSSRFEEYRALGNGPLLPFVRFRGEKDFKLDFVGQDMFRDDGRYRLKAEKGTLGVVAEFNEVPHRFGNDAHSVLTDGRIDDSVQQNLQGRIVGQFDCTGLTSTQCTARRSQINYAFLNGLVSPLLVQASPFDVALHRYRGNLDVNLTRDKPVAVHLTYFHEERRGSRQSGTSFGFGNVVETAEPIHYRTQDLALTAEYSRPWGLLRSAVRMNVFSNSNLFQTFDNPFRFTDATDASAYSAPGSGSIGGAAMGRIALPPDNKSVTGSVGFAVKFAGHSRFTADASYGQWTQNEAFIPFTTNTAITAPFLATDISRLPASSLDGRIDIFSFTSSLTSRPVDKLYLTARVRRYDMDNKTPRIRFDQGYVRFDAVWEAIPRINVPYGHTNDQAQLTAAYDFGPLSLESGYKLDRWDRTFRETTRTTQNIGFVSAHIRAADWAVLRATVERGSRSYDDYELDRSEDASFISPGPPVNQEGLRRPDQADKDITRVVSQVQLSPGGNTTFAFSYIRGKDDYKNLELGLLDSKNEAFTAEADYTMSERFSLFGFITRENISTFQLGRQSGATPSTNPLDNWTAAIDDKVNSLGAGANFGLLKDKLDLRLSGNYQKVDGNNDISSLVGGAPELARRSLGGIADIPLFDDTKIFTVNAEFVYKLRGGLNLALGGWYENYQIKDANTTGVTNYLPASLFLAPLDSDYKAKVIYGRASYTW